jgi:hypothetical protein
MLRIKSYFWYNVTTGKTGITNFDETHVDEHNRQFGATADLQPNGIPELAALRLVNRWNKTTLWHYWI